MREWLLYRVLERTEISAGHSPMTWPSDSMTVCIHATVAVSTHEHIHSPERQRWESYRRCHHPPQPCMDGTSRVWRPVTILTRQRSTPAMQPCHQTFVPN